MNIAALRVVFSSFAALAFSACASVTVKNVDASQGRKPTAAPKTYYVVPFSTAGANVKEHPMRKNPGQLANEVQSLISTSLVSEISSTLGPAKLVSSPTAAGRNGWLITGDITRINEGSRILRMAIGLGAGGTKVETRVRVTNLPASNQPFLSFNTTGGSGAEPGAATNPIPFSSAPTALLAMKTGITDDANRTGRMINAAIADYQVQRGWLAPEKVKKPKTVTPGS
jgi:Domain of unknown function (DUF4410)